MRTKELAMERMMNTYAPILPETKWDEKDNGKIDKEPLKCIMMLFEFWQGTIWPVWALVLTR